MGKEGQTLQPDLVLLSRAVGKGAVGAEGNWALFIYLLTLQTSYSPFLPSPSAKAFALKITEIKATLSRELPHLPAPTSTACPASSPMRQGSPLWPWPTLPSGLCPLPSPAYSLSFRLSPALEQTSINTVHFKNKNLVP